ncbi:hypothetical protein CROQUDRAFT_94576 [Cronartium quercuum f. sp. fusiforme G11]|uniref:RNase H type-1 domain-containing protein n=1 Tax=Cronartium quercuum f. sp. fusiforme G11 TaxID=708437 RepID=A0A9P6TA47_9BASI|nr:hypothetical protein CROQUDRAFT_94576 [Cronartium quercuum f. sp. fusiforme G11]
MVIFTDGSLLQGTGGGAAATSAEEAHTATFTLSEAFSNNEMEYMGISLGIAQFHDQLQDPDVAFFGSALFPLPPGSQEEPKPTNPRQSESGSTVSPTHQRPKEVLPTHYRNIVLRLRKSAQPCPSGVVGLTHFGLVREAEAPLCLATLDSQTARLATHRPIRPTSGQYLVKFLKEQINRLPGGVELDFFWTPGHEDIPLNELADKAAKRAAEAEGRKTALPPSLASLLQATWKSLSCSSSDFPTHISTFKTPAKLIADAFNRLEKGHAAAIFQLRTGHCPLNDYLHRFKRSMTRQCRGCGVPETVPHFLLYCGKYRRQRAIFRQKVKEEKIKVKLHSANRVLDTPTLFPSLVEFILATGRFEHLCSYLPDDPAQV